MPVNVSHACGWMVERVKNDRLLEAPTLKNIRFWFNMTAVSVALGVLSNKRESVTHPLWVQFGCVLAAFAVGYWDFFGVVVRKDPNLSVEDPLWVPMPKATVSDGSRLLAGASSEPPKFVVALTQDGSEFKYQMVWKSVKRLLQQQHGLQLGLHLVALLYDVVSVTVYACQDDGSHRSVNGITSSSVAAFLGLINVIASVRRFWHLGQSSAVSTTSQNVVPGLLAVGIRQLQPKPQKSRYLSDSAAGTQTQTPEFEVCAC